MRSSVNFIWSLQSCVISFGLYSYLITAVSPWAVLWVIIIVNKVKKIKMLGYLFMKKILSIVPDFDNAMAHGPFSCDDLAEIKTDFYFFNGSGIDDAPRQSPSPPTC